LGPFLNSGETPYGNRRQFPYGDRGSETDGLLNRGRGFANGARLPTACNTTCKPLVKRATQVERHECR
jgi:hypothetical protein